jgi:hypothetical protein
VDVVGGQVHQYSSGKRIHVEERSEALRHIVKALDGLVRGYPPAQAGEALAQATGEGRALDVLREGIAYLQRVLEEAEREQGRMQGGA